MRTLLSLALLFGAPSIALGTPAPKGKHPVKVAHKPAPKGLAAAKAKPVAARPKAVIAKPKAVVARPKPIAARAKPPIIALSPKTQGTLWSRLRRVDEAQKLAAVSAKPRLPSLMIQRRPELPEEKAPAPSPAPVRAVQAKEKGRTKVPVVRAPRFPPVTLHEANLREDLSFRPFDEKGRPRAAAAKDFERFLRDHHTGKRHAIDPRLGRAVYEMARHFNRRIEVFSGYRPRQFSSRKHSRHITGSAIDFRIPGVRNEALVRYLRDRFHPAGVGYYPNGVHVHLDVDRVRDTYWVDTGDAPSPVPTDRDADEATVDETVVNPPPAAPLDAAAGIDDDPGLID
ncbi:MAG: DUF882 domain-containing protein [Myxococcales bacterium]|nr:DUF882 domain-containing protein [Myxococcales bacterium]